jgi:Fic family protein
MLISVRKSPRKGSLWDVFKALLYAPEISLLPNVVIELAVVDVAESRVQDGLGSWRRKGVSITDKRLTGQYPSVLLSNKADYRQFAPFAPGERFTVKDLAAKAGIKRGLAAKALWTLAMIGAVEKVGKRRREAEYEVRG